MKWLVEVAGGGWGSGAVQRCSLSMKARRVVNRAGNAPGNGGGYFMLGGQHASLKSRLKSQLLTEAFRE